MKKKSQTRICVRCNERFPIEKMYRLHGSLLCETHYDESAKQIADIWAEFADFCSDAAKKE